MREELGLDLAHWHPAGSRTDILDGRRNVLHVVWSLAGDLIPVPNRSEVIEARWFRRDALPDDCVPWVEEILRAAVDAGAMY
jgi:hypothetical protein